MAYEACQDDCCLSVCFCECLNFKYAFYQTLVQNLEYGFCPMNSLYDGHYLSVVDAIA